MLNNKLMRRDVAIEIIAEMIADTSLALDKKTDEIKAQDLLEKRKLFKKQRSEIYAGNEETIEYVLDVYGSYLKEQR